MQNMYILFIINLITQDKYVSQREIEPSLTKKHQIAVLPGDGIGPEVTAEAVKVL